MSLTRPKKGVCEVPRTHTHPFSELFPPSLGKGPQVCCCGQQSEKGDGV